MAATLTDVIAEFHQPAEARVTYSWLGVMVTPSGEHFGLAHQGYFETVEEAQEFRRDVPEAFSSEIRDGYVVEYHLVKRTSVPAQSLEELVA